jgi:hypothetical protein
VRGGRGDPLWPACPLACRGPARGRWAVAGRVR